MASPLFGYLLGFPLVPWLQQVVFSSVSLPCHTLLHGTVHLRVDVFIYLPMSVIDPPVCGSHSFPPLPSVMQNQEEQGICVEPFCQTPLCLDSVWSCCHPRSLVLRVFLRGDALLWSQQYISPLPAPRPSHVVLFSWHMSFQLKNLRLSNNSATS